MEGGGGRSGKGEYARNKRTEYVRNHRRSNAIGLVYGDGDGRDGEEDEKEKRGRTRRRRDAKESGEESFIIAQLWNEEVSYETTLREY